jgi:hypothetical protein
MVVTAGGGLVTAVWGTGRDTAVPSTFPTFVTPDAADAARPDAAETTGASGPAGPAWSWFPAPTPARPGKLGTARGVDTGRCAAGACPAVRISCGAAGGVTWAA